MRILVTNDDGVDSPGLHALARALASLGDLLVVAPATNQTAKGRSITLDETVLVDEVRLPDGRQAFAVEGTPVDCVRFSLLGLEGTPPDIVVAGVNEGANLGDDIGYSGTVAAAIEGLFAGLPAVALSQRALDAGSEWVGERRFDYRAISGFAHPLVERILDRGLPEGTLLNVNAPGLPPEEVRGVRATRLGRRIYRTSLDLVESRNGRRRYRLWDEDPGFHAEDGTDFAALADGCISVTPLHFDLTAHDAIGELTAWGLEGLVEG